jgi:hypothetical protein
VEGYLCGKQLKWPDEYIPLLLLQPPLHLHFRSPFYGNLTTNQQTVDIWTDTMENSTLQGPGHGEMQAIDI